MKHATPAETRAHGVEQAHRAEWGPEPELWASAMTEADWECEARIMEQEAYREFLESKIGLASMDGFEVDPATITAEPILKPHIRAIVPWALRGGRRALFLNFGLGKTRLQLELMRLILGRERGAAALIVLPLGVRQEFRRDADAMGLTLKFIRSEAEVEGGQIHLTNYETIRDGKLDPNLFLAVSLDEASVLRSFGSKTYQTFLTLFDQVKFKFVATATPDPNRTKELIHYAGFLGVMDTGQALTRFFQRNSEKANDLTLYPHKEEEFWLWVHSWALFLDRPSDLGFSDEGYALPPLEVHYHEVSASDVAVAADRDGQGRMFHDASLGVSQAAAVKRGTLGARLSKMLEIRNADPAAHCLLWHDLEDERRAIEAATGAVSVYGSLDLETREQRIIDFSDGRLKDLAVKPELSGSGCNFQRHCHKSIYLGVGFKFNDFIQSIHRIYRFLQDQVCEVHLIYSEAERPVLEILREKWAKHEKTRETMRAIVQRYGLNHVEVAAGLKRTIGVERIEECGASYVLARNDAVAEAKRYAEASVDLVITSIPFSNHYEYTPQYEDFGHTADNAQFWRQMDFLTPELFRILKPGRLTCIHVKDRILFGSVTGAGAPTVSPLHNEAVAHYAGLKTFGLPGHGFDYLGMITVVTDVVRENNQTYRLGWSEQCKDGTKMGVGSPEYVLLFRKPQTDRTRGYGDEPVRKSKADFTRARWQTVAHAFWRSSGDGPVSVDELAQLGPDKLAKLFTQESLKRIYDHEDHVRIGEALEARGALPSTFMAIAPGSHHPDVWHDVNRMRTLNTDQSRRAVEKHVCPLQFDIIDRLIERYSNRGDLVYDPFMGLGSVAVRAIRKGRRAAGSELNESYFRDSALYCRAAEAQATAPTLFDLIDADADAADADDAA